jgi:single-strand DNA-binding protein
MTDMATLNNVQLLGRLTRDPELRYTPSGKAVCSFSIAVDHFTGRGEDRTKTADFFDIVAWEQNGIAVADHQRKGAQVLVSGRLATRSWEAQDGTKRRAVEVVAQDVQFLDRPAAREAAAAGGQTAAGARQEAADDIPF